MFSYRWEPLAAVGPTEEVGAMATKNPQMVCPHCQTKGNVYTERTKMKQGISGARPPVQC
jgi:hypothetical protein